MSEASESTSALGGEQGNATENQQETQTTNTTQETQTVQTIEFPENWKEGLPEEIRNEDSLKVVNSIPDMAKSYVHSQKMIGKNKVIIPDWKYATDKDIRDFSVKSGLIPEDKDKYSIESSEKIDSKFMETFKEKSYELNVPAKAASELLKWYEEYSDEMVKGEDQEEESMIASELDKYKAEVGQAYDRKVGSAREVINKFGDDYFKELMQTPLGNHPSIIRLLSDVGEKLFGEESITGNENRSLSLTHEEAKQRWTEIQSDPKHAYWTAKHPGHKDAVEEVHRLFSYMSESSGS